MNAMGWFQFALFMGILLLLTKPMGLYLTAVLDGGRAGILSPLARVENFFYRLLRVDPKEEQSCQAYVVSVLTFSLVTLLFTYAILRFQDILPLNPQKLPAFPDHLAF